MSELRIIKKYSNRRLYDTQLSRYVTVADLRQWIVDGVDLEVRDTHTGNDITRHILLQIISEQESGGNPIFTKEVLIRMIRFYGGTTQQVFANYLDQSLRLFMEQQQIYQDQFDLLGTTSFEPHSNLAQQNLEIWREAQQSFLKSAGLVPNRDRASSDTAQKIPVEATAGVIMRDKGDERLEAYDTSSGRRSGDS